MPNIEINNEIEFIMKSYGDLYFNVWLQVQMGNNTRKHFNLI